MKTAQFAFSLALVCSLAACSGRENPVALQPVQVEAENPILDMFTKLGADGRAGGPITLYSAVVAQGVPSKVAKKAFEKFDEFQEDVRNTAYISIVDFTQHSKYKRFYMINRASGKVDQWSVAHGTGSDPDNDGMATSFSNVPNSKKSSLGAYLIQEKYIGKYGESLRLDGLESTNDNARDRAIVMHPSNYVNDNGKTQGRSWGCPAVPYEWIKTVISRARDGSFMYAYGVNKRSAWREAADLAHWNNIPRALWPDEGEGAPEDGE